MSETVTLPVSVVPLVLLSIVGLKVSDIRQLPPADIDDPHEFPINVNEWFTLIDAIVKARVLGLVIVTVLTIDEAPKCTLPKVNEVGENFALAGSALPYARP